VSFEWITPFSQYDAIYDYKIYWDSGLENAWFTLLASSTYGQTQYVASGLVTGIYYQFKVAAVNTIGESDQSVAIILLAAQAPDTPGVPTVISSDKTFIII
jgi:hypothetical protein